MPASQIYTVDVIGTDPTNQAAWDAWLTDIYSNLYNQVAEPPPPPPQEPNTAEPAPIIPEVVVEPPKLTPAPRIQPMNPAPPANDPLFEILPGVALTPASIAAGIVGLLFPQPTGPRALDEAPSPIPDIPEIEVRSTRLPYGLSDLTPNIGAFPYELPQLVPDFGFGFPDGAASPDRSPYADPFIDPVTSPWGLPNSLPQGDPSPRIRPSPEPAPRNRPLVDPIFEPVPLPRASPRPGTRPLPDDFFAPVDRPPPLVGDPLSTPKIDLPKFASPIDPFLTDFTNPLQNPEPEPESDPCARGRKNKKKEKEKRPPRTLCWKGTYVQRSRGISYTRKEQVPCAAAPTGAKSVVKKLGKKLKPGQFPTTALTGSQIGGLAADAFSQFAPILSDWWLNRNKASTKPSTKKRNRKAKTKPGRLPGTVYTSPFPTGD